MNRRESIEEKTQIISIDQIRYNTMREVFLEYLQTMVQQRNVLGVDSVKEIDNMLEDLFYFKRKIYDST